MTTEIDLRSDDDDNKSDTIDLTSVEDINSQLSKLNLLDRSRSNKKDKVDHCNTPSSASYR